MSHMRQFKSVLATHDFSFFTPKKSHHNLSHYIQFLFKKIFEFNKNAIIANEKMRNSGNYNYDYAHSFFGKDF